MGKASRRQRSAGPTTPKVAPAPHVARPFAGLANEPDWVAIREILPAATAVVRLDAKAVKAALGDDAPADVPTEATIATVLPMAWPGLHRNDGVVFIGTQSGSSSGDASRDLAAALLATLALEPGTPLAHAPAVNVDTPRLQDLLEDGQDFAVELHDGFDFWVGDSELDAAAQDSLERANDSIVPMVAVGSVPSAYHVTFGDRSFLRVIVPEDEDVATDALARLHAADEDHLGEGTRLLGAFRACGLLVPVIEIPADAEPTAHADELAAWAKRYAAAAASDAPLTPEERRARGGLLSRQMTLR